MRQLKRREFMQVAAAGTALGAGVGRATGAEEAKVATGKPIVGRTFTTDREDGRFVETAGFVHKQLRDFQPKLAFDEDMPAGSFPVWRDSVREKLLE